MTDFKLLDVCTVLCSKVLKLSIDTQLMFLCATASMERLHHALCAPIKGLVKMCHKDWTKMTFDGISACKLLCPCLVWMVKSFGTWVPIWDECNPMIFHKLCMFGSGIQFVLNGGPISVKSFLFWNLVIEYELKGKLT